MAYTAPPTVATGDVHTAALWNTYIRDDISFLAAPPMCRVRATTSHALAAATYTFVPHFGTEDFDTNTMHSTTSTGIRRRITIKTKGKYYVSACADLGPLASTSHILAIERNSTAAGTQAKWLAYDLGAAGANRMLADTIYSFSTGDYIVCSARTNTTGTVIGTTAPDRVVFSAMWQSS